jgi:hypothetical protein
MNSSCNFCQILTKVFRQISVRVIRIRTEVLELFRTYRRTDKRNNRNTRSTRFRKYPTDEDWTRLHCYYHTLKLLLDKLTKMNAQNYVTHHWRLLNSCGRNAETWSLNSDHILTFQSLEVSLRTTRFNIQEFYMLLALRWVFYTDLRTNIDLCFIHH